MMPTGVNAPPGVTAGESWRPASHRAAPGSERVASRYRVRGNAAADAAGAAVVNLGGPPLGSWWLVDRLVVRSSSPQATEARLYVGEVTPTNEEDSTTSGNADIGEYPRGLYVAGGAALLVVWSGAAPGADCYASAQVAEMLADG